MMQYWKRFFLNFFFTFIYQSKISIVFCIFIYNCLQKYCITTCLHIIVTICQQITVQDSLKFSDRRTYSNISSCSSKYNTRSTQTFHIYYINLSNLKMLNLNQFEHFAYYYCDYYQQCIYMVLNIITFNVQYDHILLK